MFYIGTDQPIRTSYERLPEDPRQVSRHTDANGMKLELLL